MEVGGKKWRKAKIKEDNIKWRAKGGKSSAELKGKEDNKGVFDGKIK